MALGALQPATRGLDDPRQGRTSDPGSKALQSVLEPHCAGCGRPFTPVRRNQRHCRPSCRGVAFERRRAALCPPRRAAWQLFE
jgi:hypothetical protein